MKNPRVRSFLLLAFGSTWLIAGVGAAFGIRTTSGLSYVALAAACMLMPALSAIVQQRLIDRGPWNELGLSVKALDRRKLLLMAMVGVAIVPTVLLVVFVLGDVLHILAFGHASVTNEQLAFAIKEFMAAAGMKASSMLAAKLASIPAVVVLVAGLLFAVILAFTANLPFMLGEELGWRGYLYHATSAWPPIRRVPFTGVVWGLWHAPLILMGHNYPGYPVAGIFLMVVFCTLLAFLFDWSRTRVGAVWGPCVLHGIINGSAGLFGLFAWGGHPLVGSPVGLVGFVALGVLCGLVWVLDGRGRRSSTAAKADP